MPPTAGTTVYINLRTFGAQWYDHLETLPDKECTRYFVEAMYMKPIGKGNRMFDFAVPAYDQHFRVQSSYVAVYGNKRALEYGDVLLSKEDLDRYECLDYIEDSRGAV